MTKVEMYTIARWAYKIGEEFMSDPEYNAIDRELKDAYPSDKFINSGWATDPCPTELLTREGRVDLIREVKELSHSGESMPTISSYEELNRVFRNLNKPTRVSYKEDGWNTAVDYVDGNAVFAHTRGRSSDSREANVLLRIVPPTIPIMGEVKVYGETVIPNSEWSIYSLETGNTSQRASVSTAIARGDSDVIHFSAFNIFSSDEEIKDKHATLKQFGFEPPMSFTVNSLEQLLKAIEVLGNRKKSYPHPTDGLVVENDELQYAIRVGEYGEERLCSYITGYVESVGVYGFSLSVNIKPVKVNGTEQTRVDVTNVATVVENNLRHLYPIAFSLRASATPVFDMTGTAELHAEFEGRYEEYREMIDKGEQIK